MTTHLPLLVPIHFAFRAVRRHWRKGAAVGALICAAALLGTRLVPKTYYSEARLLVQLGDTGKALELLRNTPIQDLVLADLGPGWSAAGLGNSLTIEAPPGSQAITVAARAGSPEMARQIVAALVAVGLKQPGQYRSLEPALERLREEADATEIARQAAADRLAAGRLNAAANDARRKVLETQLREASERLATRQSELKLSAGRIAALGKQISALPSEQVNHDAPSTRLPHDDMRRALEVLTAQEENLAAKLSAEHPKLAAVRQQAADMRAALAGISNPTPVVMPEMQREALERSLLIEQSQARTLQAGERSLAAEEQDLRASLALLQARSAEIQPLEQDAQRAEATYRECTDRLAAARRTHAPACNLALIQPASPGVEIQSLRQSCIQAGLLMAAGSALGTILLAAWLNPVVTTAGQLATVWDVPLVATIPRASLITG